MNLLRMKPAKVLGFVGSGVLAGTILAPEMAQAQMRMGPMGPSVNPCPSIYYEEPYDSNVLVPPGCRPNTISRFLGMDQGNLPLGGYTPRGQGGMMPTPPLPETRENAIAVVPMTEDQSLTVRLMNTTNVPLNFEVVGQTDQRILEPRSSTILRGLSAPLTLTAVRLDEGLLDIMVTETDSGTIEFTMDEDLGLDDTQGVIRIQQDGQVFVN